LTFSDVSSDPPETYGVTVQAQYSTVNDYKETLPYQTHRRPPTTSLGNQMLARAPLVLVGYLSSIRPLKKVL